MDDFCLKCTSNNNHIQGLLGEMQGERDALTGKLATLQDASLQSEMYRLEECLREQSVVMHRLDSQIGEAVCEEGRIKASIEDAISTKSLLTSQLDAATANLQRLASSDDLSLDELSGQLSLLTASVGWRLHQLELQPQSTTKTHPFLTVEYVRRPGCLVRLGILLT